MNSSSKNTTPPDLRPKSKSNEVTVATTLTTTTTNTRIIHPNSTAHLTTSPETPPPRRGWTDFSPIKLSPLKLAPSSPQSSSSRDHSPSRDSPDLFEAHTQLDQSPSSSPATPVIYQGSELTPPPTPRSDNLQRDVTQLDLGSTKSEKLMNDRSMNDRSMARLLRMETRLDYDDTSHAAVTDVKHKPALLSANTTTDLLMRTSTVMDVAKNSADPHPQSHSAALLSRATTLLDSAATNSNTVKWQLIGQGVLSGHVIELLEGDTVHVGRGAGCVGASVLTNDKLISARHLWLMVRDQHCWLTDLSSNGTWLNGVRLGKQFIAMHIRVLTAPSPLRLPAADSTAHWGLGRARQTQQGRVSGAVSACQAPRSRTSSRAAGT